MKLHLLALAILVAPLLAAACGADSDSTQPRRPAVYPTNTRDIPAADQPMNASPQDMPGKGRGSEPLKGKP